MRSVGLRSHLPGTRPGSSVPYLPSLADRAALRLAQLEAEWGTPPVPPLMEFIPATTPKWMAPTHLREVVTKLERFKQEPFEFCFSVPPRHGKSQLLLHFIVWALLKHPELDICYVTYNADQAEAQGRIGLTIAESAGLNLTTANAGRWQTSKNRWVQFTGIDGSVTGRGYDLVIIDDAHKNRAEAESPRMRERAWAFYQNDLSTRLEPGGSFISVGTRWHEDDLNGRLLRQDAEGDWEALPGVNIPAILDEDTPSERALWPQRWPLEALKKRRRRVGAYAWASLFQGRPVPRGSTVFGEPTFYTELPKHYRVGQGLDLSYTEKKTSDYSVIVTIMREIGADGLKTENAKYYVTRVIRKQQRAPDFKREARLERTRYPSAKCRIYAGGTETGAIDFLRRKDIGPDGKPQPGLSFEVMAAKGDKFTRAIAFAAAWNDGRVLLPAPELAAADPIRFGWVHEFIDELRAFTGTGKDANDDQVDAAVAAFDVLETPTATYESIPSDIKVPRRM